MKIGFIGLGNMATAMIGGMVKKEIVRPEDIIASARTQESVRRAEEMFGIVGAEDNVQAAKQADILFLAVKPQMYEDVITQIRDAVREHTVVVSIAPGKTISWMRELFAGEVRLVRCMPNTPALVGEGCTGFCAAQNVTEDEIKQVQRLLESFGKAYAVPEHLMDTVVGVSGSSPAYVFLFIEAMADAAVMDGMPRTQAYEFAAQAVLGSAKMVLETGMHPGVLKDMVCSPGGTTIEAVRVLEEKGLRSAVIEAQKACVDKARGV